MARNGKIILSKGIKLDKSYKQVLSLSESNMISLMSDSSHLVSYKTNYSFIRERGSITVGETYANCLKANYMAFQNTDYSGKWFFAFIDNVVYVNNATTEIYYTVDVWTTWFDYWNPHTCYIVRQHATSDVIGSNTVPENLEHGEYIGTNLTALNKIEDEFDDWWLALLVAVPIDGTDSPVLNIGNAYLTGSLYLTDNPLILASLANTEIATEGGQILACYIIPRAIIPNSALTQVPVTGGYYYRVSSWTDTWYKLEVIMSRSTLENGGFDTDGFVPVNKKLFTYPYCYCLMTNNNGASNVLRFEDFVNGQINVKYYGVPTVGGSIIAVPFGYKNITENFVEGLVAGKFPTLGWSEDAYTNWLTQNAVNNQMDKLRIGGEAILGVAQVAGGVALASTGAGATIGAGLISSGASTLVGAGVDAFNDAKEDRVHQMEPDSYKGNVGGGDILTAIERNTFIYRCMTIKSEYARKLDKFFTRYGYMQKAIMQPNLSHRANYNFVQIAKDSTTAYSNNHNNICVPASDLESINNIFRSGVTVWNNHTNMGDYSVSNGITS